MKVSLFYKFNTIGGWNEEYSDFLGEAVLAETEGFEGIYVGENHFESEGWCPSPFFPLSSLTTITSRIKLGTNIIALPLHNSIEVSEQIAFLDVLSNGRAILGVGLGFKPEEFIAFGRDIKKRKAIYEKNLEEVKKLLSGEAVEAGPYSLKISPQPVQKPRIPIWIAARTPGAVKMVVKRGDAWIMDPVTSLAVLQKNLEIFRSTIADRKVTDFPLRREYFISKDASEIKKAEDSIVKSYEREYFRWEHLQDRDGNLVGPSVANYSEIKDEMLDNMIIGTPSQVIEKMDTYRKRLGITELILRMSFKGITSKMRMEAIKLTGELLHEIA